MSLDVGHSCCGRCVKWSFNIRSSSWEPGWTCICAVAVLVFQDDENLTTLIDWNWSPNADWRCRSSCQAVIWRSSRLISAAYARLRWPRCVGVMGVYLIYLPDFFFVIISKFIIYCCFHASTFCNTNYCIIFVFCHQFVKKKHSFEVVRFEYGLLCHVIYSRICTRLMKAVWCHVHQYLNSSHTWCGMSCASALKLITYLMWDVTCIST